MADRSTAAVDMADGSGASLTQAATRVHALTTNVDESEQQGNTPDAADAATPDAEQDGDGAPGGSPAATATRESAPDTAPADADVPAGATDADAAPTVVAGIAPVTTASPDEAAAAEPTPEPAPPAAEAAAPSKASTAPSKPRKPSKPSTPPAPAKPPAPELHSGHKLAARYRLEECLTRADGFSSWRAVDEMLRRAVGVHVLPASHRRARRVLAAARSAALLGNPRFVQVLDAVEEDELCYVVHEWLPDAVDLTTLLADGPLPAHQADQMVRQLAEAMTAAHREGLAHLMLSPHTVLCTEDGQFHVRGLAVAAALHGVESSRPAQDDTQAIGALLYAALTHRWPHPEDAHGLTGLPSDLGLVPPDQVRAGVPRGLAELAMRALVNDGATATSQEPACASPAELARAAAALPRLRPPEPEPGEYRPVGYRQTAYGEGSYRQPPARRPVATPAPRPTPPPPPPPALPGRAGRLLKWTVASLLIVALALGSWQITQALFDNGGGGDHDDAAPSPSAPARPAQPRPVPLEVTGAQAYAAEDGPDNAEDAHLASDGDLTTYWHTQQYYDGPEAVIVKGLGLVFDLGADQQLSTAKVRFPFAGDHTTVHLYAADAPDQPLSAMTKVGSRTVTGDSADFTAAKPVDARYVVVWLTALPPESSGRYRQGITEVEFTGLKK